MLRHQRFSLGIDGIDYNNSIRVVEGLLEILQNLLYQLYNLIFLKKKKKNIYKYIYIYKNTCVTNNKKIILISFIKMLKVKSITFITT